MIITVTKSFAALSFVCRNFTKSEYSYATNIGKMENEAGREIKAISVNGEILAFCSRIALHMVRTVDSTSDAIEHTNPIVSNAGTLNVENTAPIAITHVAIIT